MRSNTRANETKCVMKRHAKLVSKETLFEQYEVGMKVFTKNLIILLIIFAQTDSLRRSDWSFSLLLVL